MPGSLGFAGGSWKVLLLRGHVVGRGFGARRRLRASLRCGCALFLLIARSRYRVGLLALPLPGAAVAFFAHVPTMSPCY